MNRAVMAVQRMMNKTMSKMYTMVPMVRMPVKVCGCTESSVAKPPVLIVNVNQAHVKLFSQQGSQMLEEDPQYSLLQTLFEGYLFICAFWRYI